MVDNLPNLQFLYQPMVNLRIRSVVGIKVLVLADQSDRQMLLWNCSADRHELISLDVEFAAEAIRQASVHETLLPLHLEITADSIMDGPATLAPLGAALQRSGRRPGEVVLEIKPCYAQLGRDQLVDGVRRCRLAGYRIAFDGVGSAEYPLELIAAVEPDMIKVDPGIVAGVAADHRQLAVLEALSHLAPRIGAQLVADGVNRLEQLAPLRRYGVCLAQGDLFCTPSRRPTTYLPDVATDEPLMRLVSAPARGKPRRQVRDLTRPALALADTATAEEVRTALMDHPTATGAVLVNPDGRACFTLDRNRFMLAVSGHFGHALYSRRRASPLGDAPRMLRSDANPVEALDVMRDSEPHRRNDDIVVVDPDDRCVGVLQIGEVLRGVAEMNAEHGASLHPLTGLPGTHAVAELIDQYAADGEAFTVSWLEVVDLGTVADTAGFTAADDIIRRLGHCVVGTAKAIPSSHLAHSGGDGFLVVTHLDDVMQFGSAVLDGPFEIDGTEVALSLVTLICGPGSVHDHRDVSRLLARVRRRASSVSGTRWVFGRAGSDRYDVVRGDAETREGRHHARHRDSHVSPRRPDVRLPRPGLDLPPWGQIAG